MNSACVRVFTILVICSILVACCLPCASFAQEDDAQSEFQPGLLAIYENLGGKSATRIDSAVAFAWGEEAPDPRLVAWPFRADWRGFLLTQADGPYRLSIFASGSVRVWLDGHIILDGTREQPGWLTGQPVELSFGWKPLDIRYESGSEPAQIALYWSGPGFELEPVPPWHLFHDASPPKPATVFSFLTGNWRRFQKQPAVPTGEFQRGEKLARALRCEACHRRLQEERSILDVPSLEHVARTVQPAWLVDWLASRPDADREDETSVEYWPRRMPHFGLSRPDAIALTAYLLRDQKWSEAESLHGNAHVENGRKLFLSIGCLACHGLESFGDADLFGGGDLSQIAAKRPNSFFAQWLTDPASLNPRHRMPVFALTDTERADLSAFLSTLGRPSPAPSIASADLERGERLFRELRCSACHDGAKSPSEIASFPRPLGVGANWENGCLEQPDPARGRVGYGLASADRTALVEYFENRITETSAGGEHIFEERNCLACHSRGRSEGISARLPDLVETFPDLAPAMSSLAPPSLNSVGDKLHDVALVAAIRREGAVRRPWLQVRMPRFHLSDHELSALVRTLIQHDRIPPEHPDQRQPVTANASEQIGARLVTQDGFGCTSCHAVGSVRAPNAPLHTIGPDLLRLDQRIRREWFDRWVRNPSRIVPRMEMPSVQTPASRVLDENLDLQLAAVWETLSRPEFRPPDPEPVRTVRRSADRERGERAIVLTDVLEHDGSVFIKPLLVALPNRHNLLLDCEHATVAGWWSGDAARQRTRGKSWYWESAGQNLFPAPAGRTEFELHVDGRSLESKRTGQFVTGFDEIRHVHGGVEIHHRIRYTHRNVDYTLKFMQRLSPHWSAQGGGIVRQIQVEGLPQNSLLRVQLCDPQQAANSRSSDRLLTFGQVPTSRLKLLSPESARLTSGGAAEVMAIGGEAQIEILYESDAPVEQLPALTPEETKHSADELSLVPGFTGVRLPTRSDIMPTGLTWTDAGELVMTSLKGEVWRVRDSDADGLEDEIQQVSDELAAPYGLVAGKGYIDVINKYALLRLIDDDHDGFAERTMTLAAGWGHTADYHDWAVGLLPDGDGYLIALPCQQDQRSEAAAHLRGSLLRLEPNKATAPYWFDLKPISSGHRFPMGLARNMAGDVFVTDNQGNYNPFNELNHVRAGAHFGFINALERETAHGPPPLVPPAVNVPHPWTRSVNGICLLKTPDALQGHAVFEPFEGQLVGCEYDTRRLVRMSLEKVNDTYQGAVYPLSTDQRAGETAFIGPLVAAVSPRGELYVGCIRDSGWGGANNIGGLVRLTPQFDQLPAGISEIQARPNGFRIRFTRPVSAVRAASLDSYVISSYRRIATPDYGGPDVDRRFERPLAANVSDDGTFVDLEFGELREGFVYEFHLRNLAPQAESSSSMFFPAEAYYTLHRIPAPNESGVE